MATVYSDIAPSERGSATTPTLIRQQENTAETLSRRETHGNSSSALSASSPLERKKESSQMKTAPDACNHRTGAEEAENAENSEFLSASVTLRWSLIDGLRNPDTPIDTGTWPI